MIKTFYWGINLAPFIIDHYKLCRGWREGRGEGREMPEGVSGGLESSQDKGVAGWLTVT